MDPFSLAVIAIFVVIIGFYTAQEARKTLIAHNKQKELERQNLQLLSDNLDKELKLQWDKDFERKLNDGQR